MGAAVSAGVGALVHFSLMQEVHNVAWPARKKLQHSEHVQEPGSQLRSGCSPSSVGDVLGAAVGPRVGDGVGATVGTAVGAGEGVSVLVPITSIDTKDGSICKVSATARAYKSFAALNSSNVTAVKRNVTFNDAA